MIRGFAEWQAEQAEFTSLSLYAFRPMKGAILLTIDPEFVSRLVDAFYGGSGAQAPRRAREFTPTEESLLAACREALIGALDRGLVRWSRSGRNCARARPMSASPALAGGRRAGRHRPLHDRALARLRPRSSRSSIRSPRLRSIEPELAAKIA